MSQIFRKDIILLEDTFSGIYLYSASTGAQAGLLKVITDGKLYITIGQDQL